jgi:hypothetical protein
MLRAMFDGMAAWLAAWEGRELRPLPPWFREMELAQDRDSMLAMLFAFYTWPATPADLITAPVLVIVGSAEDPDGEAPAGAARMPHASCVTLPDRHHAAAFLAADECLAVAEPFLHSPAG